MVPTVALWGAEIGWRGQQDFERKLGRLQYQALSKVTGAVTGASIEKVSKIAAVEDARTVLDSTQEMFMARSMQDPSKLGDIFDR